MQQPAVEDHGRARLRLEVDCRRQRAREGGGAVRAGDDECAKLGLQPVGVNLRFAYHFTAEERREILDCETRERRTAFSRGGR